MVVFVLLKKGNVSDQQVSENCNNNGIKVNSELVTVGCHIVLMPITRESFLYIK